MDVPKCRSISSSRSKKGQPRRSARILPTVVVPTQLTPTRLTRNSGSSLRRRRGSRLPRAGRSAAPGRVPDRVCLHQGRPRRFRDLLVRMQLPGGHQRLIGDGVAGAPHLFEPDKVPGQTAELHETIFTRRPAYHAIAPSLRAPPFLGTSPTLHHWPGPAAEGRGGISGCSYLLEILARRSACGLGGVIQIQEAMDGFPQVMLGITAGPTMVAPPIMIPVGGVHRAQAG
jgi:hypothetical protein